jgi:regulation of enolase protein 1 (concanavalin A-like superfamily)
MKNGKLIQLTRNTLIDHNVFSRCGMEGGITLGVGGTLNTTVSHNYFTQSGRPYTIDCGSGGLEGSVTGNCIVEYNHFDDVQTDADDAGVIVVTGMSSRSIVRNNLIHNVHRGFFSDNVAFWFDNLSVDWTVTNNVYYDLEQGEMKTCGTYLSDNNYSGNFLIEPPVSAPEKFIEGDPDFTCSNLQVTYNSKPLNGPIATGSIIRVTADITNKGSSGAAPVVLYLDRKIAEKKFFPVIRDNKRTIEYLFRVNEPGRHEIAIGETMPRSIEVTGEKPTVVFDRIQSSEERILEGESVTVNALATNLTNAELTTGIHLLVNGKEAKTLRVTFAANESKEVKFELAPQAGACLVQIGNSAEIPLNVLKCREIDLKNQKLLTYVSPKAKPAEVEVKQNENRYVIKASGWDFYHAEDAYATVYLPQLEGDFIATAKISKFGNRTSEWYRSGLFVRNVMSQSFDVDRGSKGSVLMFSTPGRAGIEYDEFGNGCMHKAASENLPENSETPIWLKLERHGDRFTGYVSLDGHTWVIKRVTNQIPGIGKAIDIGLAAGAPDQKQYTVEFEEWKIKVQE